MEREVEQVTGERDLARRELARLIGEVTLRGDRAVDGCSWNRRRTPLICRPRGAGGLDTTAPVHQNGSVRLTVNLEPDLYAVARSLASAEDCSISAAVNRLLRRSLRGHRAAPRRAGKPFRRGGFAVSPGRRPVTADTVRKLEAGDDRA
jgi:hypothetical protein